MKLFVRSHGYMGSTVIVAKNSRVAYDRYREFSCRDISFKEFWALGWIDYNIPEQGVLVEIEGE